MNIETLKIDLAKKLFETNEESILEQIKNIFDKKNIVAYTVEGKPLTLKEYNHELSVAEEDIKYNRISSSEELKNEMKNW